MGYLYLLPFTQESPFKHCHFTVYQIPPFFVTLSDFKGRSIRSSIANLFKWDFVYSYAALDVNWYCSSCSPCAITDLCLQVTFLNVVPCLPLYRTTCIQSARVFIQSLHIWVLYAQMQIMSKGNSQLTWPSGLLGRSEENWNECKSSIWFVIACTLQWRVMPNIN